MKNVANLDKKTFSTPIFVEKMKAGEYQLTELQNEEDPNFMSKIREEHAQETKTPGHKAMCLERAIYWAKKVTVKLVHMDRQYRSIRAIFRGTVVEQYRGDVVIEHVDGRIDVEEIRSRTDKPAELEARTDKALALLPPEQKGKVAVVPIPGVVYPEDRSRR